MRYEFMKSSLSVKLEGKSRMVQLALEAFALSDYIVRGQLTGGIDAPRIVIYAEEMDDGSVVVCWKNQDTCGLSDCIYHYSDTSPHEDIYKVNTANQLEVNGKVEQFGLDIDPKWVILSSWASIEGFFNKWGLTSSGPSKEECEKILEQARRNREKKTERTKKWLAENPLDK